MYVINFHKTILSFDVKLLRFETMYIHAHFPGVARKGDLRAAGLAVRGAVHGRVFRVRAGKAGAQGARPGRAQAAAKPGTSPVGPASKLHKEIHHVTAWLNNLSGRTKF
uniref:Uncharacterized protein n=1 Tax=Paramormyrops kingsleyae TaxID=1676925 RepID=A0A3B3S942_9TELE